MPHLAPSYAAVASLVTLGGHEALGSVNKASMLNFIQSMARTPAQGGGFQVCQGATGLYVHIFAVGVLSVADEVPWQA